MRRKTAVALVALASLVIVATAVAQSFPARIDLPRGWQPEGIAAGNGNDALRRLDPDRRGRARRRPHRAHPRPRRRPQRPRRDRAEVRATGGCSSPARATGRAWVYSASTGRQLGAFQLAPSGADTFVNDVVVTPQGAYFTDSRRMVLYRVPRDLRQPAHADGDRHPAAGGQQPQRHRRDAGRRAR